MGGIFSKRFQRSSSCEIQARLNYSHHHNQTITIRDIWRQNRPKSGLRKRRQICMIAGVSWLQLPEFLSLSLYYVKFEVPVGHETGKAEDSGNCNQITPSFKSRIKKPKAAAIVLRYLHYTGMMVVFSSGERAFINRKAFFRKGKCNLNKCGISLPTSGQTGHEINLCGLVRHQNARNLASPAPEKNFK